MTAAEELVKIDAAIANILDGQVQSYQANGRQTVSLALQGLWARKAELERKISRESTGSFWAARMRSPE